MESLIADLRSCGRWGGKLVGLSVRALGTRRRMKSVAVVICALLALLLVGCGSSNPTSKSTTTPTGTIKLPSPAGGDRGGDSTVNVYSADTPGDLSPAVRGDPALVYVPNSLSNTVDVISQRTLKIVEQFPVGALPQHVTPSYDLRTLYVDNDVGNSLTPINPRTGRPGQPIPVEDPYNLYFTPDGRFAIVVAERLQRLDFRNPNTMHLIHSLSVPACRGVDHMDFSADGRYAFASCEFAGRMIEIDLQTQQVIRTLVLEQRSLQSSGCEAISGRPDRLYGRSGERRRVGDRRLGVPGDRVPEDWCRSAWALPEPQRRVHVRL